MDFKQYQQQAIRTAKRVERSWDLNHAALGLTGEAGEFADAIKKHVIYNQPLDNANCIEELGDILWYCALAAEALGVDLDEVAALNISKLKLRYPDVYSDLYAKKRLDKESLNEI